MTWNSDFKDKDYVPKTYNLNNLRLIQSDRSCVGSVQSTVDTFSEGYTAASLARIMCVMFCKAVDGAGHKVLEGYMVLYRIILSQESNVLYSIMYYIQNSHKC